MWEQIKSTLTRTPVLVGVASAASAAVAGTLGYRVAAKRLESHYAEISQKEIEDAKAFYSRVNKTNPEGEKLTLEEVAEERLGSAAAEAIRRYGGADPEAPAATEEELIATEVEIEQTTVRTRNVFVDKDDAPVVEKYDGWDYETELARRSGDSPYIITEEEFLENATNYAQIPLTYFEEDDVLVDDGEDIVPDSDIIGEENLARFGHGTKDKNGLFVRNEDLETDFEIKRSNGSYTREVLGFIEHSDKRTRKFRNYDE